MKKIFVSLFIVIWFSFIGVSYFSISTTDVEKVRIQKIADVTSFKIANNDVIVKTFDSSSEKEHSLNFDFSNLVVIKMTDKEYESLNNMSDDFINLKLYYAEITSTLDVDSPFYKNPVKNMPIYPKELKDKFIYYVDDVTYADMKTQLPTATYYDSMNVFSKQFKTLNVDVSENYINEEEKAKFLNNILNSIEDNYKLFYFLPFIMIILSIIILIPSSIYLSRKSK